MVWDSPRIAGYLRLFSPLCQQFVRGLLACYVVAVAGIRSPLCAASDASSETHSSTTLIFWPERATRQRDWSLDIAEQEAVGKFVNVTVERGDMIAEHPRRLGKQQRTPSLCPAEKTAFLVAGLNAGVIPKNFSVSHGRS